MPLQIPGVAHSRISPPLFGHGMKAYHTDFRKNVAIIYTLRSKCATKINLQQRLQSQIGEDDVVHQDQNRVLEAANSITLLAEDAMMYWSPDYFPMMW
ncbi:hypothetical protein MY11210_006154 [Beauveria gryllotalpidicola]